MRARAALAALFIWLWLAVAVFVEAIERPVHVIGKAALFVDRVACDLDFKARLSSVSLRFGENIIIVDPSPDVSMGFVDTYLWSVWISKSRVLPCIAASGPIIVGDALSVLVKSKFGGISPASIPTHELILFTALLVGVFPLFFQTGWNVHFITRSVPLSAVQIALIRSQKTKALSVVIKASLLRETWSMAAVADCSAAAIERDKSIL